MINVLIVEDDPMVADINKTFVEMVDGFKVVNIASNGQIALDILSKEPVDLVILDKYMPVMCGMTLLEKIRSDMIDVDILLITASSNCEDINLAFKYGAIDYLIKPFDKARLISVLENIKRKHKVLKSKKQLTQLEIDSFRKNQATKKNQLPKGLHKKTQELVLKEINTRFNTVWFDVDNLSHSINMSSVTIRKYLEFLENCGILSSKMDYKTYGRPKKKYILV